MQNKPKRKTRFNNRHFDFVSHILKEKKTKLIKPNENMSNKYNNQHPTTKFIYQFAFINCSEALYNEREED